jgi:hypothetical protein
MQVIEIVLHRSFGGFYLPSCVEREIPLLLGYQEKGQEMINALEFRTNPELVQAVRSHLKDCANLEIQTVEFEGTFDDIFIADYDGIESLKYKKTPAILKKEKGGQK